MNSLLTADQKEKLRKLDEEMANREKDRAKREQASKSMGIPIEIVDMDVIKIGVMLGLIKKQTPDGQREGSSSSILDLILGDDAGAGVDTSLVPKHYTTAPKHVTEMNKIQYQQAHVEKQTAMFSQLVTSQIKSAIGQIRRHIYFDVDEWTIDSFIGVCRETMDVLLEQLEEEDAGAAEWETLQVVRSHLLGPLNVCEYRNLLKEQIERLCKMEKPQKQIVSHLTPVDKYLSLYSDSLAGTSQELTENDKRLLLNELQFRTYTRNPTLVPFNFDEYAVSCCTPLLLCLPLDVVLRVSLLGPYLNNSIGFLPGSPQHHTFYVLDKILEGGARLWVVDIDLIQFCESLIKELVVYLIKIFRMFYKSCFFTNRRLDNYTQKHPSVFDNLSRNIKFLCAKRNFHHFLKYLLISKSCIIPTNHDFFNYIETCQQPQLVYFEEFDNLLYNSIINELFDK